MKTREQEAKMTKVVEDNSVVLERMKSVSSSCDTILQTIDNIKTTTEPTNAAIIEPQFVSVEPVPELEEEGPAETQDLKKMTKKELLSLASEIGCNVRRNSSKATIIRAIIAAQ